MLPINVTPIDEIYVEEQTFFEKNNSNGRPVTISKQLCKICICRNFSNACFGVVFVCLCVCPELLIHMKQAVGFC